MPPISSQSNFGSSLTPPGGSYPNITLRERASNDVNRSTTLPFTASPSKFDTSREAFSPMFPLRPNGGDDDSSFLNQRWQSSPFGARGSTNPVASGGLYGSTAQSMSLTTSPTLGIGSAGLFGDGLPRGFDRQGNTSTLFSSALGTANAREAVGTASFGFSGLGATSPGLGSSLGFRSGVASYGNPALGANERSGVLGGFTTGTGGLSGTCRRLDNF